MIVPVGMSSFANAVVVAAAVSSACAALSVVVVLRRWAFIGEGISHAGFGGIGTAWLLSLAFPVLAGPGPAYLVAVLFCLAAALAMGYVGHGSRFGADAAIGIFLVASLAWGFLCLALYNHVHGAGLSQNWEQYLFGNIALVSPQAMVAGVGLSAGVLLVLGALAKEVLSYSFDPAMAQVSGVRAGLIHYVLMLLVALVIVVGMRIVGNMLVPALLILPGATAMCLSRRLGVVLAVSIVTALIGGVGGLWINHHFWPFLPVSGPAIVLVLFLEFLVAWLVARVRR